MAVGTSYYQHRPGFEKNFSEGFGGLSSANEMFIYVPLDEIRLGFVEIDSEVIF